MKKVLFSFAMAAMMFSLMACGGKTVQNQEGQDSTAAEAETEAVAEAPENVIDNEAVSLTLPEGWVINENGKTSFLTFMTDPENPKKWIASVRYDLLKMSNTEKWLAGREVVAGDDLTIDGKTFKSWVDKKDGNNCKIYFLCDMDNGLNKFEVFKNDFNEKPGVKQVLESVKFK